VLLLNAAEHCQKSLPPKEGIGGSAKARKTLKVAEKSFRVKARVESLVSRAGFSHKSKIHTLEPAKAVSRRDGKSSKKALPITISPSLQNLFKMVSSGEKLKKPNRRNENKEVENGEMEE